MKKSTGKKLLIALLAIALMAALAVFAIAEGEPTIIDSGYCGGEGDGTNLTWTLDSAGTLTIRGTGQMLFNGSNWYYSRESITTAIIEDGVTSIGGNAFIGCTALTSITIPSSVRRIGEWAFSSCKQLNAVFIDELSSWLSTDFGTRRKDDYANPLIMAHNLYVNGELLTDLVIPDGTETISPVAFCGCTSIESVTIPTSLTKIGMDAFSDCSNLSSICIQSIEAWNNVEGKFNIVENKPYNLYLNGNLVTELAFPNGTDCINCDFLRNCASITTVKISSDTKTIGDCAFYGCIYLTSVEIPDSVTSIGVHAFRGCINLPSVSLPKYLMTIDAYAFSDCDSLTEVFIPSSVNDIDSPTFSDCKSLMSITVADDNQTYSSYDGALYNKEQSRLFEVPDGKKEITLPSTLITLSSNMPNSVTVLGGNLSSILVDPENKTYSSYDGLLMNKNQSHLVRCPPKKTNIYIPSTVEYIDTSYGFYACYDLLSITVDENNPYHSSKDGVLFNKDQTILEKWPSGKRDIMIPDSVTTIAVGAFAFNKSIVSITLPAGVTTIEGGGYIGVFDDSSIKEIFIPTSLTSVGEAAFKNCHLSDVYYAGTKEQWANISIKIWNESLRDAPKHFNWDSQHVHDYTAAVTTPATCTSTGVRTYICTCGDSYTEDISVDKNNHINTTNLAATASTCTVKGYSAGVYCNDCKQYISGHQDLGFDTTNHVNTTNVAATASTCTVKGYTAGVYCNDCKKYISGHAEQPLAAHTSTIINAREATYDAEGYTGDTYCTVCKQTLSYGTSIPKLTKSEEPTNPTTKPTDEKPTENLNFFQRIIQWFRNLFARLFGR
ncbi:MAG: leucine-rich repeat domain-containing protein [Clostridia bacterium]|nr:leucine-rich repeat domain-containing protein [Clostridia bacterium]